MSWSECCGCAMVFYAACQRHIIIIKIIMVIFKCYFSGELIDLT